MAVARSALWPRGSVFKSAASALVRDGRGDYVMRCVSSVGAEARWLSGLSMNAMDGHRTTHPV